MTIKKGDKVKVDYEGKFESGEVFDTSKHDDHSHPLEFEVGKGMVIPGFDNAVVGMEKGGKKEIKITPADGYGELRDDLKKEFPRENLPKDQEPKEGMMIGLQTPDGHQVPAKIIKVDEKNFTVDLNHPLAGKTLIFNIEVIEVTEAK
jgi:peptidylprolyl isomerase